MDSWLSLSLLIFGVITASMLVIVLAPKSGLMWFFQREVSDPYSLFSAAGRCTANLRHWCIDDLGIIHSSHAMSGGGCRYHQ